MVDYLLSGKAKNSVAKKMDMTSELWATEDLSPLRRLIREGNETAQAVAASNLSLLGPLACDIGDDLEKLHAHPSNQVRMFAASVAQLCGFEHNKQL
jgi:hypothetical protein